MAKYVSGTEKKLNVGITSFSENKTSLTVVGNVGIGTTNATSNLHVNGSAKVNGLIIGSGTTITSVDNDLNSVSSLDDTLASAKAIKSYVDSQVFGINLNNILSFDTNSGIGSVYIGSEVFDVLGVQNEIETIGSGTTLTIGLPDNVRIQSSIVVGSAVTINSSGINAPTGIVTASTFSGQINAGVSTLGITTATGLSATQLSISGVSTFAGITTVTGTTLFSRQLNVSGISTLGITTTAGLSATQLSVSGVSTFAGITTVTGTTLFSRQLNVSGISTLGITTATGLSATQLSISGVSTFNNTLNVVPTSTSVAGLFSGTTSSDMVRITQLGTGNALVVEDEANPDASPFVVTGVGTVGIGITNPSIKLTVNGGLDSSNRQVRFVNSGTGDLYIKHANLVSSIEAGSSVQLALGGNGAEVVRINSTGVGIATANPIHRFQVGTRNDFVTVVSAAGTVGVTTTRITGINTSSIVVGQEIIGVSTIVSAGTTVTSVGISSIGISPATLNTMTQIGVAFTFGTRDDSKLFVVTSEGDVGIGTTNPTSKLHVVGDAKFTGVVTATSFSGNVSSANYATNAGLSTNLKGGLAGNLVYQSATDITAFLANGSYGTILQSNGVGNAPSWVNAAPANAITGLTIRDEGNVVGGTNSVSELNFVGNIVSVASTLGIATITFDNAGVATALQNARTFEITGDIVASPISFDGTGNVSLAATIQPNSVALGGDTTGDYVQTVTGTANQIVVTGGTGESSTPVLSIPNQFTVPQDVTVTRDLQVNRNLNVNGNITIGGTSAAIFTQELKIFDPDIVLGVRTDAFGNDVSNDNTANHGGVALASTEGTPLVQLFIAGIETNPATYKKIMWFKAGEFAGLGTDAWLSNYAVGIGSTQFPTGTRLAAGNVQFTQSDLAVVRNINSSGVVTATTFVGTLSGFASTSGVSTSVIGGIASVTQLSVSGVSTFNNNVYIPSSSVGIGTTNPLQRLQIGTANTLGINTTGTVFVITSNADVGIGTTNPISKLHVIGDVRVTGVVTATTFVGTLSGFASTSGVSTSVIGGIASVTQLSVSGVSTFSNNIIQTSGSVGLGTTNPLQRFQIGTANTLGINTTGTVFVVTSNADVGIGTTNPTTKLDVRGNVNISGVVTATTFVGTLSGFASTSGVSTSVIGGIASVTQLSVSGVSTFSSNIIQTSGSVGLGTTNPLQRLQIGTANTLGVNTTGTVFVVTSNADVGIGTTNPTTKLDVRGNVNISGVVTASSFVGTLTGTATTATNVIGGIGSLTQLSVSGVSTFNNNVYIPSSSIGIGTTNPLQTLQVGTANTLGINTTGTVFVITSNADVGIGTTNPTTKLDVRGNVNISGVVTATTFVGQINAGVSTISVNSSTDALRITQLGSGNALVVEDSANPDATPFVVTGTGSVGIGTTNPGYKLSVYGNPTKTSADGSPFVISSNDATNPFQFLISRSSSSVTRPYWAIESVEQSVAYRNLSLLPTGGNVTVGSTLDTGTASQPLQVTGGAYVSTRLGVGVTNPASNTQVAIAGTLGISEVGGAGTRTLFTSSGSGFVLNHNDNSNINIQSQGSNRLAYQFSNNAWAIPSGGTSLLVGTGATTGTTNQLLRVEGGAYVSGSVGIGTTNPTSKLDVIGDAKFTGVVTATSFSGNVSSANYATNAGLSTNLKGGLAGNIPYQSGPDTTVFLSNGNSGYVLQSNGVGNAPSWVAAAPVSSITGLTIQEEGSQVGTANAVNTLNFIGYNITATASGGISTITVSDSIVGTALSISGISTFSSNIIQTSGSVGLGTTNPLQRFQIGTANTLGVNTTGTVFVVTSNADVGIGTTNPIVKLDVRGNVNISGVVTATSFVKSGGTLSQFLKADGSVDSSTYLTAESDTLNSVTGRGNSTSNGISVGVLTATSGNFSSNIIQTSGSVGLGTTNPLQRFQIGTANTLGINTTGTVFVVTSNAGVGIGTTNPSSKLHVVGDVLVSGVSTFIGDGTAAGHAIFAQRNVNNTQGIKLYGTSSGNFVYSESTVSNAKPLIIDSTQSENILFRIAGGTKALIQSTGEVLIGSATSTGTASQLLQVNSGGYFNGLVGIGTTNPTSALTVQGDVLVSGIITSTDYNSTSDINLKENIQKIENPVDKVLQLNGVSFNWKESGRPSMGVIAQEVERVIPELVNTGDVKTVNYNGLIGLLIEVVKEQQKEIDYLKGKIG